MDERLFKVFEHPVLVSTDLLTEVMVREELSVVLNQRVCDIEDNLRREAAIISTSQRESSCKVDFPTIREAISSVDVTNLSQEISITEKLNSGKIMSSQEV